MGREFSEKLDQISLSKYNDTYRSATGECLTGELNAGRNAYDPRGRLLTTGNRLDWRTWGKNRIKSPRLQYTSETVAIPVVGPRRECFSSFPGNHDSLEMPFSRVL